jgi:hypothetical protein
MTPVMLARRRSAIALSLVIFSAMVICQPSVGAAAAESGGEIVVWNGTGAGWTNPDTSTIQTESTDVHGSTTGLQFAFHDGGRWLGAGWNWMGFKKGAYGTDISQMRYLTFWAKSTGDAADLQINLLCNGKVADTPEHHTDKVHLSAYCPNIGDGSWHLITIPLSDLKQPDGFDAAHVCEIQLGFMAHQAVKGSYTFDGIAFKR